ncbi:MAG TPA: chlorite dismutase family protein [Candidatus Dormibacteraeota bacterium]|jgi:chlorite dismutase|nr:chlorite dismutase family protein [Candidatus Dormibacteraeota bacterium]
MAELVIEPRYVQALALGLDPAWRRQSDEGRCRDAELFVKAVEGSPGVQTHCYSTVGLEPGVDVVIWRLAPALDALEDAAAAVLRAGLGRWLHVVHSFLGVIQGSQYVRRPTTQEQSLFTGERSRYLIVYPFTKETSWYLMGKEARQGIMNEHIRIGHSYPQVRQLLANSFGLDDQDFLVAYETDDLPGFSNLVRELRGSDSRRSTVRDTPILTAVHRSAAEITRLLGA